MYYLQSRYYNPEWGRFINADALIGVTGALLSHNTFCYCENNPINAEDPSGFLAEFTYGNTTKTNRKSSFNYQSAIKGTAAGFGDLGGKRIASSIIKGKKVYAQYGSGLGQYVKKLGKGAKVGSKILGAVGSIGFTGYDVCNSISKRQYYGATVDLSSGIAGGLAGFAIGAAAGAAITAGMPVLAVGALGFAASVGAGMMIDGYSSKMKSKHYRW